MSFSPSTSTFGSSRSSHLGSHQAFVAEQGHHAGISIIRTTKASKTTAAASAKPDRLDDRRRPGSMNAANTEIMITAAAVTTRALLRKPSTTASRGRGAVHVRLAHPGHQEHLVVHRQAEHHADQEDRHEADDRLALDEAEGALLEDRDRRAEGGQHREQEAERRGQRHQDRAEHQHQQQERQPDDDREVDRQRVGEPVGDVGR